ncbi:MAG: MmgE/PrpD family protein [Pseudonocardia sp.]|nr:MmgE/PrpD family protein [Pseudonocardia sp.]MBO0872196.1 MmgE/PrpD family protein [Pseudonocardia sp.]
MSEDSAAATKTSTMTAAAVLADRAVAARSVGLAEPVRHAAVRAVVDWYGAAVAGGVVAPATLLRGVLPSGGGRARLLGAGPGVGTDARTAALVNGTAAHTVELDDIYSPGLYHPGAPTVAAAMAVADERGSSGLELLRAVTVGYELGNRVAETVNPAHYAYWHTTGTVGAIGAAAAVAELVGLDAERFGHALATATTFAAGLQQAFRSDAMSKPLHAGRAAEAGVLAALAAEAGVTGASDVLEGAAGFGAAMSRAPDWSTATAEFDGDYRIQRTSVKPYPCCGHAFAPIDACLALREQGVAAGDVAQLSISSYGTALAVAGNPAPTTGFEAKFSIPFVAAVALLDGAVTLESFDGARTADPEIRRLLEVTELVEDPELTGAFPSKRGARAEVVDKEGRSRVVKVPSRSGDPDNPIGDQQLDSKMRALVGPVVGAPRAEELSAALWRLAEAGPVREELPWL